MNRMLRLLFFTLVVRPVVLVVIGLNVRHRRRLPKQGPALLVANHNSHLDTMVLITVFPLRMLSRLRPVAAQDYFHRNKLIKWFSQKIIGIIPIQRKIVKSERHPLEPISDALRQGNIVIVFPEGSRGEPERLSEFKTGIAHLAERHPEVPVCPVYMHGLGKALPRGEALLVPFFCDVFVGESFCWTGNRHSFMDTLTHRMTELAQEDSFPPWE